MHWVGRLFLAQLANRGELEMTQSNTIRIIAGYGRSGTTWIQDVIAQANSLRAIFEPLHPEAIAGADPYAHAFVSKHAKDDNLYRLLDQFFSGKYPSVWADYRIRTEWFRPRLKYMKSFSGWNRYLSRIAQARRYYLRYRTQRKRPARIIKFVRANMLLSWIQENFDARIVFVIRHPAAVVLSQFKSPNSWYPYDQIERYRSNASLLEILDDGSRRLIFESLGKIEALTLCWCVENSIALQQARESNIVVVHYEEILEHRVKEWGRISHALDLHGTLDAELISRPSQQAWGEQAHDAALVKRYAAWMDRIDKESAQKIQGILDVTGTRLYRISQPLPITGNE